MKKKISVFLICVIACALLSACNPFCDHVYGEWETFSVATCNSDGVDFRRCVKCDKREKLTRVKKEHNMVFSHYAENNCLRCRIWNECTECLETEYIIADELANGNHVYDVNNACQYCDSVYEPTSDEFFYFRGIGEAYSIERKLGANLPTDLVIPIWHNGLPVTTLERSAFSRCTNLESVTIGGGITTVDNSAFYYCDNLREINIGNSVKTIGNNAFNGCTSLTSVKLGNNVNTIGTSAFNNCSSLTSITIPIKVSSIEKNVFKGCDNLQEIWVDSYNKSYKSIDGVLYSKDGATLVAYPKGKRDNTFVVPQGVIEIAANAFEGCNNLKNVIVSDSVKTIGTYAFTECENLESVTIGKAVVYIGQCAFWNCDNLTSAIFLEPTGWITYYVHYSSILENELADSQKAAQFLVKDYDTETWERESE